MKRSPLACAALAAALLPALAAPEFAPVLQDHMVLQRDCPVTLWGTARAGETVTVAWKGRQVTTKAAKGVWEVVFPATPADAHGSAITATDSTGTATLSDVLVGEVWLASGQSNMEWRIRQHPSIPRSIRLDNPQVRVLHGLCHLHATPPPYTMELYREAMQGRRYHWSWRRCAPENIQEFSAPATFFATRLQEELRVPVGIIGNALGGSSTEAWLPPSLINGKSLYAPLRGDRWMNCPTYEEWSRGRAKHNLRAMLAKGMTNLQHPFRPAYQYEVAVAPLAKLNIRGVLWYQGEANANIADIGVNVAKMKDLVTSWRKTFRNDALPFLMVQLPRLNAPRSPYWPEFREAQARVARKLPHVGLVCTIDLGSADNDLHPPQKLPLAHRLADLALAMAYGRQGLPTYPQVAEWKREGSTFTLTYDQALTTSDGKAPRGFVVGRPGSFAAARAKLQGNTITLTIPQAFRGKEAKLTWRYFDSTNGEPNVVGARGALPAMPGRPAERD